MTGPFNHPTVSIARALRAQYDLMRIDLVLTDHGVTARAYPSPFNPIAKRKRERAFRAAEQSGGPFFAAVTDRITAEGERQLAYGHAKTIAAALDALAGALADLYAADGKADR